MEDRRNRTAWLILYWIIAAACISGRLYSDHLLTFDTWWHLAMGGQILRDWQIPPPEIFSFTAQGVNTHYHAWLAGVTFEIIHATLGLGALECLTALLVMVTAIFCARIAEELGSAPIFACLAIPAFFFFAGPFLIIRPHLFTFFLFALLIRRYLRGEDEGRLSIPATVAIFGLWTNLHGGFLLGLAFLAAVTGLELAGRFLYGKQFFRSPLSTLRLLIAAIAGTCLHPQGFGQIGNVLLHDPLAQGVHLHINEWLPPSEGMIFAVTGCTFIGLLLALRNRAIFPAIILALFCAPAVLVWRHLPLFGVAGVPAFLALLSASFPPPDFAFSNLRRKPALVAIVFAAWFVFLGAMALRSEEEILSTAWAKNEFPVGAADFLSKQRSGSRIFNSFEWGGYLLYKLAPEYRVYMDSRIIPYAEVYPEEFFTVWLMKPGWEAVLHERKVDLIVVRTSSKLWEALSVSPQWEIAFQDESSGVLRISSEPFRSTSS